MRRETDRQRQTERQRQRETERDALQNSYCKQLVNTLVYQNYSSSSSNLICCENICLACYIYNSNTNIAFCVLVKQVSPLKASQLFEITMTCLIDLSSEFRKNYASAKKALLSTKTMSLQKPDECNFWQTRYPLIQKRAFFKSD